MAPYPLLPRCALQVAYLVGLPILGYSVQLGKEHVELAEAKMQKRIIERNLEDDEIDSLAVMAVAGMASEGMKYDEVRVPQQNNKQRNAWLVGWLVTHLTWCSLGLPNVMHAHFNV